MRALASIALAAAIILSGPAAAAPDPVPTIGPPPSWVVPPAIPPLNKAAADAPLQFLASSAQERILPDGIENYVEYAAVPLTTGGLQALGNVTMPWNVERVDLTIHKVAIRRGTTTIDLLKPGEMMVLRRENNLERAMLDGVRTVVIPARGLEVGDLLSVAFSYKTKPSSVAIRPEEIQNLLAPVPIAWLERRFLVPDGVKVSWKISPGIAPPRITSRSGITEHRFVATDVKPFEPTKFAPSRYALPIIQVTGYGRWSEVADRLAPLFDKSRRPVPGSPLLAEADRIAAGSSDPGTRMLAALRLAQERVRYVALLLGEGAYVPSSADETWERKFGDCKGKTSLLLALLDRLGIAAEPLLVSSQYDDRLTDQLPTLLLFDHVFVRANIGGKTYYLDPVGYGQRTLAELTITPFSRGLPLRPQAELEVLAQSAPTAPVREVELAWDGSGGLDGPVPFEATLTLRGSAAAAMRAQLSGATDMAAFDTGLKDLVPVIGNDDLKILEKSPEAADGSFVVRFGGSAEMDWSPFEGTRKARYAFSHTTLGWQPDFDRSEGPGRDWPVVIGADPYWERMTETVILPDGGRGYALEASALDKSVAGSSIRRSVTKSGNRVTMIAEFRHLQREISAEEARSAIPVLDEIRADYAYVVGPPQRKRKAP